MRNRISRPPRRGSTTIPAMPNPKFKAREGMDNRSRAAWRQMVRQVEAAGGAPELAAIEIELVAEAIGTYRRIMSEDQSEERDKQAAALRGQIKQLTNQIMKQARCAPPPEDKDEFGDAK